MSRPKCPASFTRPPDRSRAPRNLSARSGNSTDKRIPRVPPQESTVQIQIVLFLAFAGFALFYGQSMKRKRATAPAAPTCPTSAIR